MTSKTLTQTYTAIHEALDSARPHVSVPGFGVRMLLALDDLGGSAGTDTLAEALQSEGSAIRRAAQALYAHRLATGKASDGRRVRPGQRSVLTITTDGRAVVARARKLVAA